MRTIQCLSFGITLFILILGCSGENALSNEELTQWVEQTIDSALTKVDTSLLSVYIQHNDKQILNEDFGAFNRSSPFPLKHFSKTFTGIIVNSLINEGKLNLDDPVSTYLSDDLDSAALQSFDNITLRSLLNHRSGIVDKDCSYYLSGNSNYNAEHLNEDLNKIKIGEEDYVFQYSNFGYVIIGLICEKISGKTFDQLLEEYVIINYDLNSTSTASGPGKILNPAEGLYSTHADLVMLQKSHIESYEDYVNKGQTNSLILTEETVRTRMENWTYGMGLMQIESKERKYLGYYRHSDDYSSVYLFSIYPNVGLTLLTNNGGLWLGELAMDLMDGLVDQERMSIPIKRSLAWTMFSMIEFRGIDYAIEWYLENKGRKKYKLSESEMNRIGYRLLGQEDVAEAIAVFQINVEEFPESSNVYDSLGEAYLENGDEEMAKVNYQKSLDLDSGNSRARRVLKRLNKDEEDE